jgi:hypothetical protein
MTCEQIVFSYLSSTSSLFSPETTYLISPIDFEVAKQMNGNMMTMVIFTMTIYMFDKVVLKWIRKGKSEGTLSQKFYGETKKSY